jgi:hypothetical protein
MGLFDRHDITEILLKVALNTINLSQTNQTLTYKMQMIVIVRGSYNIVLTECKRTAVINQPINSGVVVLFRGILYFHNVKGLLLYNQTTNFSGVIMCFFGVGWKSIIL